MSAVWYIRWFYLFFRVLDRSDVLRNIYFHHDILFCHFNLPNDQLLKYVMTDLFVRACWQITSALPTILGISFPPVASQIIRLYRWEWGERTCKMGEMERGYEDREEGWERRNEVRKRKRKEGRPEEKVGRREEGRNERRKVRRKSGKEGGRK